MTTMTNWLLDDSPSSRLQASLGHSYRVTRMLMRNPLAVVGALILLVLILAAIFAPWIAPTAHWDKTSVNACCRPLPRIGWAPMSWAATSLAASFTARVLPC